MGLLDALFRSSRILGIAEETLEFAIESSEATHPNEYMGFLRGTEASRLGIDRDGLVITDILVMPGTESNSVSATVRTSTIPNDVKAVGSVHSHPNGVLRPSQADLATFGRGTVHVIIGAPYDRHHWQAFDSQGHPTDLQVIDVELPDSEEFFHFTQADIDEELQWADGEEPQFSNGEDPQFADDEGPQKANGEGPQWADDEEPQWD